MCSLCSSHWKLFFCRTQSHKLAHSHRQLCLCASHWYTQLLSFLCAELFLGPCNRCFWGWTHSLLHRGVFSTYSWDNAIPWLSKYIHVFAGDANDTTSSLMNLIVFSGLAEHRHSKQKHISIQSQKSVEISLSRFDFCVLSKNVCFCVFCSFAEIHDSHHQNLLEYK